MAESIYLLAAVGVLLLCIVYEGLRLRGILGSILIAQAIYWTFSYILRPIILITLQPMPRVNDSIADGRVAAGGYEILLPSLLRPIILGLFIYVIMIALITRLFLRRIFSVENFQFTADPYIIPTLYACYIIGCIFRGVNFAGSDSALVYTLADLAAIGSGGLLIFLRSKKNYLLVQLGLILGAELLWSVLSASKTPMMAAALMIVLRFAVLGWTAKRLLILAFGSSMSLLIFPFLQGFKLTASTASDLDGADAYYPVYIRPVLSVVRRFDLFSAVTDSTLRGPGQWLSLREVGDRLWQSFVPQSLLGFDKIGVGTLWSTDVRSASLGIINEQVSLAEGFIAEGYALNGYAGIFTGAVFMAILSCVVSKMIFVKSRFILSVGLLLLAYPVLFERGILASFEIAGKSIQTALIVVILHLLFRPRAKGFTARHLQMIDSARRSPMTN